MRIFLWVVLLALIASVGIYAVNLASEDTGFLVGHAFGNPTNEGEIEIHIVVSTAMVRREGAPLSPNNRLPLWNEWANVHFFLTDATGRRIDLKRENGSTVVDSRHVPGMVEFFLVGKLDKDQPYTLIYHPKSWETLRFRYSFTAPTEPVPFAMKKFETMKD